MTQEEINDAEWRDPANWRGGWLGFYFAKRDTRVLVPKKNPVMGFTVNLAHRAGVAVLIALTVIAVAGAVALVAFSAPG